MFGFLCVPVLPQGVQLRTVVASFLDERRPF